jgi:hypothetical protein
VNPLAKAVRENREAEILGRVHSHSAAEVGNSVRSGAQSSWIKALRQPRRRRRRRGGSWA